MTKQPKARLLLLSDLWGQRRVDWLAAFTSRLTPYFNIDFKDACELTGIELPVYSEEALHYEFVERGIEHAANVLAKEENKYAAILGVSVGGVIGYRAILRGLKASQFYALCATRWLYETKRPSCPILLHFGSEDPHKPKAEWFSRMQFEARLWPNEGHTLSRIMQ